MQKNKLLLIGGIIIGVAIIAVALFVVLRGGGSQEQAVENEPAKQVTYKQLTPEDIGLVLTPIQNNQVVQMEIEKPEGIESIEYELSYDAIENGETVSRGAIGEVAVADGQVSRDIDLGSCSTGVCKYDKGVTEVRIVLKVNFSNGEKGMLETVLPLESEE